MLLNNCAPSSTSTTFNNQHIANRYTVLFFFDRRKPHFFQFVRANFTEVNICSAIILFERIAIVNLTRT